MTKQSQKGGKRLITRKKERLLYLFLTLISKLVNEDDINEFDVGES